MKFLINKDNVVDKVDLEYTDFMKWYAWYPVKVIHKDNKTYHYAWFEYVKKRLCIILTKYSDGKISTDKIGHYRELNWIDPKKG